MHWFKQVAEAASACRNVWRVSFVLGDLSQTLEQCRLGGISFDRIFMSNVPDYTSSLVAHLCAARTLKRHPKAYFRYNVLLNNSYWKSRAHALNATTLIQDDSMYPKLLGTRHLSGELYDDLKYAALDPLAPADLASPADVKTWLSRLLLSILAPPMRESRQGFRECCPNSIHAWFRAVEGLLEIGYPKHLLVPIVDLVVAAGQRTELQARWPEESPTPLSLSDPVPARSFDLTPFRADIRAAAASWIPALGLPVNLRGTEMRPIELRMGLDATFMPTTAWEIMRAGFGSHHNPRAEVLGILFWNARAVGPPAKIRDEIVLPRDYTKGELLQLVSAYEWDAVSRIAKVWIDEEEMKKMRREGWSVCFVRTDQLDAFGEDGRARCQARCLPVAPGLAPGCVMMEGEVSFRVHRRRRPWQALGLQSEHHPRPARRPEQHVGHRLPKLPLGPPHLVLPDRRRHVDDQQLEVRLREARAEGREQRGRDGGVDVGQGEDPERGREGGGREQAGGRGSRDHEPFELRHEAE